MVVGLKPWIHPYTGSVELIVRVSPSSVAGQFTLRGLPPLWRGYSTTLVGLPVKSAGFRLLGQLENGAPRLGAAGSRMLTVLLKSKWTPVSISFLVQ